MVGSIQLAKFVLQNASVELSNLELQKILFLIEIDYVSKFDKPLIEDEFEAWQFGPILKEVYYEYRCYGGSNIDAPKEKIEISLPQQEVLAILDALSRFEKINYWKLVEIVHQENGAWKKSYVDGDRKKIKRRLVTEDAKNPHYIS